jgi:16S rRNA (uracil1498-N3)-methyltransferase
MCERSVPRFDKTELGKKMARWKKLLDAGTEVSGEIFPPRLEEPAGFGEVRWRALPAARYAAVLARGAVPISDAAPASGAVAFAVGPEGDWTEGERAALAANGFVPVSLGRRIMRASTAALAGIAWFRLGSLSEG